MARWSSVLALALIASACGGHGEYRRTGAVYAPRGPQCEFQVIRNRAMEPYEEIGVIDIDAFSMKQLPHDEEAFRKVVGPTVCAAGGEAVIAALNVYGQWINGTVIRFHPSKCSKCDPKRPADEGA